jgi:hypothetical protein
MDPAHPLCIHSDPRSILSASRSIFDFRCQNPRPCSFSRSPPLPIKPLHMQHPICTPHIPRVYIPIPDQYRVHRARYSILGVKTPTPTRSLDPRVCLLSHVICCIPYAPCTHPAYIFQPSCDIECVARYSLFGVKSPAPTRSADPRFSHIKYLAYSSPYIHHTCPYAN